MSQRLGEVTFDGPPEFVFYFILYFILYFAHTLGGPYGPPHATPPPVQRSKGYLIGWEVRRGVLSVL